MSKSFYNYIVNDLLLGWFQNNHPANGSRYCIVVENEDRRNGLVEAIRTKSEPILINGIYEGADIKEEAYSTYALNISHNLPKLIIGDDITASEDYLTTLRNSVGVPGKYENYGILYILSKSVLSSLVTASLNLEGKGGPLHPTQIVDRIKQDVKVKITKDYEQIYLNKHLETVSELISDGTANLFDFESMMTVLGSESIKGHFNELEMFEDKAIYNNQFQVSEKEMELRAERNKTLYRQVHSVIDNDEEEKIKDLEKFLDEKLSRSIIRQHNNWNHIDLQDFLDSENRKASTDNLQLVDVSLNDLSGKLSSLIWNYTGKLSKSSKNYIVVCDTTDNTTQEVILSFNKLLGQVPKPYRAVGQKIKIPVLDKVVSLKIGQHDNHHDFYILRLPCKDSLFREIKKCFSISKKGDILVKVPEEALTLSFGNGGTETTLSLLNEWIWCNDEKLVISVEPENEEDTLVFFVDFKTKKQKITLKLDSSKPIPPLGPDAFPLSSIYKGIDRDGLLFKKITDGEIERGVYGYWREFLEWEQLFLDNECTSVELQYNNITQKYDCIPHNLQIAVPIADTLSAIYQYYQERETIPSLCPIDKELISLYKDYCTAFVDEVNKIPTGQSMSKSAHNLTRLGTLYKDGKLYLSPFHPMMVAYILEYQEQSNGQDASFAKKLLTPFYLIPYLTYGDKPMRPYSNSQLDAIRNWLVFEDAENKPQERVNDITTKMVKGKMEDFMKNFTYLFQDKDSPIVISGIGFTEDANLIRGIIEFIKSQYSKGVQRIELHEYVDDIKMETFFEKLNRLDSIDNIDRELRAIYPSKDRSSCLEQKGEYTSQDLIHQLFTRMAFYKHEINQNKNEIGYCHIAFYQMNTGSEFVNFPTKETRTELAFNGLVSIPSTLKKDGNYFIGFGTKGVTKTDGYIHPMAMACNNLYGNEKNDGYNSYNTSLAVTKKYAFKQSLLLDSIYENANWVTFLNPEVDINFFYQQDLYVVHYTDQYSINAKYDSITVTKHIRLYENILKKSYEKYALQEELFTHFNEIMKNYFNCLNGSWLLRLVNQDESKVREKMSLVATSIIMQNFLQRNTGIIWIPISLDEILRVTGEIGLKMDSIFSKKSLGIKGEMSDDLLMIGIDAKNVDSPILYFYPIEVKASSSNSNSNSIIDKACRQVSHTWSQFKEHLFIKSDFESKIYRAFFASQFLVNSEKMHANGLISEETYNKIESCRYSLLNLKWNIQEVLPIKEMGVASVVSYLGTSAHDITTKLVDGIPVCEIHLSEGECFDSVANPEKDILSFLAEYEINIDRQTLKALSSPNGIEYSLSKVSEQTNVEEIDDDVEEIAEIESSDTASESISENNKIKIPIGNDEEQAEPIRIIVGKIKNSSQEVVFEPNNTKTVTHPNMGIIGTMGTGKTQFARSLIAQFSKESCHNVGGNPVGMLVFDYKGDYKDAEFLNIVEGKCYKFNYPFNPLKLVINGEADGMNLPAITADRIADSFAKAYGLGLKQQSNIKQVIIDTYAGSGITRDPSTWNNKVPTMNDVIEKYFETYDANDKAYALFDKLRDYTIFTSDSSQCVSMFEWLNGIRVIDLTLYPDDTKKVIVSLILDLFYAEMKQLGESEQKNGYRELRVMILVDEAHQFLKKDFNSFRSIISEGRMFGVGMILSTQNISDFKTNKEDYSQFILSWIIHHVNSISKTEISTIFSASDPNGDRYMDFINKANKFESICKIGQRVCGIRDLPYFELIKEDERFCQKDN